ncbi:hypothetical protein GH714_017657 [Hevea brasiliensis]|uniref:NAD-dependent epimerase/dehydratase domain-containing protein n=1 Tax=Hevea brasiliensis TaxID=3981 RepID=A0A6A6N0A4_HEVBR|nr:hypothetical protein GH714_017657 [Hevea brasiliensis]
MNGEGKVVSVTGASGYIASWLVKFLLQRGYTVKASVRDPNDAKKTEHLLTLDGAKERLQLFKADLLEEGSFDPVVEGCEAVVFNGKPLAPDAVVDETWFSDPDFCEKTKSWYRLSKTLAEEAAWKFTKENGIDMVAINPGLVIGPLLQPTLNSSNLRSFNAGVEKYPNTTCRWVDVRGVANAHVYAFENPSTSGRYCLVGAVVHSSEPVEILRKNCPELSIPKECADDKPPTTKYQVSKERTESLGVKYTPLETSSMSGEGKVVCVTGASGYIASWLVKLLLERGYTVKATVRDLSQTFPNEIFRFVDVRDVAYAHILAFERPSASGRYCIVGQVAHFSEFLKILHEQYPTLQLPQKCTDDKPFVKKFEVSKKKATALGLNFTPLEVTIKDTIENFKERGDLSI